jgi:hypothetical protein
MHRVTLFSALVASALSAQSPDGVLVAGNKRANTASIVDLRSGKTLAVIPTAPSKAILRVPILLLSSAVVAEPTTDRRG